MKDETKEFMSKTMGVAIAALIVIGVVFAISLFTENNTAQSERVCIQTECIESVQAGQQWAQENCAVTEENQTVCQLNMQGQQQIVPIEQINLSAIRLCAESICTQEIEVFEVNESIDAQQSYFIENGQ